MTKLNYLKIQSLLFILTVLVLLSSLYFQYVQGLQPCPLCLMQRICVFILFICTGIGLCITKKAHVISVIMVLISCAGLFFASRQIWLQSLPEGKVPACIPGLDIMIQYFPWQKVALALFWGAGDCADKAWSLFGISMAGWSALYFLFMIIIALLLYSRTKFSALI